MHVLIFITRKKVKDYSSQFSNWAHKCLSSIFCQEYFMDLYLLAEMKTISLKITTVDMKRPPPDFRSNFEASQPPILIGVVHQIVSPISNSGSTNFFNEYLLWLFFNGKLRRTKNLFCFSSVQTEKNSWNKLVKTSDEFVKKSKMNTFTCPLCSIAHDNQL